DVIGAALEQLTDGGVEHFRAFRLHLRPDNGTGWHSSSSSRGVSARPHAVACDEPNAALHRDIGPRPLDHHEESVAEPDEPEEVQEEPAEPSEDSRDLESKDLTHGGTSSDRRHDAVVVIPKPRDWRGLLAEPV